MCNKELNDFIIKVFNYYNGRINVINKAVLDINWCNLNMTSAAGYSRLPNIVTINPMVISRYYDNDIAVKTCIIETIIHELYHTDQLINYNFYMSDVNYNRFIEHSCEVQTAIYITGHLKEVGEFLETPIYLSNRDGFNNRMKAYDLPGVKYQRRYFHDHIFMCVDNLCNLDKTVASKIYEFITDNIRYKNNITIVINNEPICVCLNGNIMDIEEFNNIIIKYFSTMLHTVKYDIVYNKDINDLNINIETEIINLMCKKV